MKLYAIESLLISVLIFLTCAAVQGCDKQTGLDKGAKTQMKTNYIGRFSIAVPSEMEQKIRTAKLRYAEIKELVWPKDVKPEQARAAEWERFIAEIKALKPPEGKEKVIIKTNDFPAVGKWVKGIFYYSDYIDDNAAQWILLMDSGRGGVWLKGESSVVEKENENHKMMRNIENIAESYQPLDMKNLKVQRPDNRFFLQYGAINLPYSAHEESLARFEGHPLDLTLSIEMEMDFTLEIEPMGLIKRTKGLLAAALLQMGGGISKIRLQKREVAGMPGEESVLVVREGEEKDLVFTWEYNGKDDSGEYPTTRIKMESPNDADLEEKMKIWDAILDSMQPLFERKK